MEVDRILAELREELQAIDDSIVALERLAVSKGGKKRGRPPAWLVEARERKEGEAENTSTDSKPSKKAAPRRGKKKPAASSK